MNDVLGWEDRVIPSSLMITYNLDLLLGNVLGVIVLHKCAQSWDVLCKCRRAKG